MKHKLVYTLSLFFAIIKHIFNIESSFGPSQKSENTVMISVNNPSGSVWFDSYVMFVNLVC